MCHQVIVKCNIIIVLDIMALFVFANLLGGFTMDSCKGGGYDNSLWLVPSTTGTEGPQLPESFILLSFQLLIG